MTAPTEGDNSKYRQALEAISHIHRQTMAKLAGLQQRQIDLYCQVMARLDQADLKKASQALADLPDRDQK